jgi:hypothetical protein
MSSLIKTEKRPYGSDTWYNNPDGTITVKPTFYLSKVPYKYKRKYLLIL